MYLLKKPRSLSLIYRTKKKPDNVLVDYDLQDGKVANFSCYLSDWGTADVGLKFSYSGGTPIYAGPRSFEESNKDLFSFAQLALELFHNEGLGQRAKTWKVSSLYK